MKTVEVKVYQFNELSEEAKVVALEHYRDINVDHQWWEPINEGIVEEFAEQYGIRVDDIRFSGFWSQGDGASFTGSITDPVLLMKAYKVCNRFRSIYACAKRDEIIINVERLTSRYVHENTVCVDIEYEDEECSSRADCNEFEAFVEEKIKELCREIYVKLEKYYEELTSDEDVEEGIVINEIEFLEDGTPFSF